MIIVSRCWYGGYQPLSALEAAVCLFYGKYTVFERETAKEVVERNRLNPDYEKPDATFFETIEQLNEVGL